MVADRDERDGLGDFVARVVRLDQAASVRLRASGDRVVAWASTPFEVLVSRSVPGEVQPRDVVVPANGLLAALAVVRDAEIDPGGPVDQQWLIEVPLDDSAWPLVQEIPAAEVEALADKGIAQARELAGPHGTAPDELLDRTVLTAVGGDARVAVPLRCLFALSGMGFIGGSLAGEAVRVSATPSWLRIDTSHGAVVRRRHALLPLLV
nr:hypothetical protein [Pseudonocardia spinosispora]